MQCMFSLYNNQIPYIITWNLINIYLLFYKIVGPLLIFPLFDFLWGHNNSMSLGIQLTDLSGHQSSRGKPRLHTFQPFGKVS